MRTLPRVGLQGQLEICSSRVGPLNIADKHGCRQIKVPCQEPLTGAVACKGPTSYRAIEAMALSSTDWADRTRSPRSRKADNQVGLKRLTPFARRNHLGSSNRA